jgi:hypothetical protein
VDDRQQPGERHRAGLGNHVLLGDPALVEALREALAESDEAAVEPQVGVEDDEPGLLLRLLDDRPLVSAALDEHLALLRRRAVLRGLRLDELDRAGSHHEQPLVQARLDLGRAPLVLVGARGAGVVAVEGGLRPRQVLFRLHERNAAALAGVGDHEPRPLLGLQPLQRLREHAQVVAVAVRDRPAERLELLLQVAEVADPVDPRVGLDEVPVDDRGDLVQAAVRGRLERLPELALLELAVAGEDVDVTAAAECAVGEGEPAGLGDAHPERAGAGHDLGRRSDVGVAGQAVQAAQLMDQLEVEPPERGQHRVQAGRVVALRGEVPVTVAHHLEVEPGDDVQAAESRARMARAGALDHVERVQPARVREGGDALVRVGVERADAIELGRGDVAEHRSRA